MLVAGGGGGGVKDYDDEDDFYTRGGSGGGINGGDGGNPIYGWLGSGATQTGTGRNAQYWGPSGVFGAAATNSSAYAAGGGGGWYGGRGGGQSGSGGGGSGYIGGVPAISFKGKIYEPFSSNGINSGNGYAIITSVAMSVPPVYFGAEEIIGIYYGNVEISDIKIG